MKCLIVGAGIAGLTAAQALRSGGWKVTVADKGRGPGGRLATRRIGPQRFDHGAQYFSALSPQFREAVEEWLAADVAAPWFEVEGSPRYRGREGMSAIAKHLAAGLDVRLSTRITRVVHRAGLWHSELEDGSILTSEALILTPPLPQTLDLLGPLAEGLPPALNQVTYAPCFALMLSLDGPSALPDEGYLRPESGPFTWIADNTRKGISPGAAALTLHVSAEVTQAHYDTPHEDLAPALIEAARPAIGAAAVREWQLHRWRYSLVTQPGPEPCYFTNDPGPLALAGDAFGPPRIEGAYLSGFAAAKALSGAL